MFIDITRSGYDRYGAQFAHGYFLVLSVKDGYPKTDLSDIRCFVRHAKFSQIGNFMGGRCTIHGTKIGLSGSYGGDGLTISLPKEICDEMKSHESRGPGRPYRYTSGCHDARWLSDFSMLFHFDASGGLDI